MPKRRWPVITTVNEFGITPREKLEKQLFLLLTAIQWPGFCRAFLVYGVENN